MKNILLLFFLLQSLLSSGQVFNNRYILDQTSMAFHDLFFVDDTLMTIGFGSTFYHPFPAKLMITKFNRAGEVLDYDIAMVDSLTGYVPRINTASRLNRKFVIGGGGGGGLHNRFGFYALYDLDNGLEWFRSLEPVENNQQAFYSNLILSNDHIILLRVDVPAAQNILITTVSEVNPQGETLWESSFGGEGINHRPGKIVALTDSTYLVGLEKYSSTGTTIQTLLIEMDQVGNVISTWEDTNTRTYAPRQMLPMEDGGLIYASRYLKVLGSANVFPQTQGYIVRQDADQNILWTLKTGNPSLRTDLFNMIKTMDGNYIAIGSNFDETLDNGFGIRTGYLVKFDEEGTILWEKQYYGAFGGQHKNEFYDIVEMADSSLVLCGESTKFSEDFPQRGWLVSLDKNGNLDSLIVDVKMVETRSEVSLTVYPNPADTYISLELTNENIERVELYSLAGQLLRREEVYGARAEISVADLPAGVYSVLVNGRYGKRVVVF